MTNKKEVEQQTRGWIPKEPSMPSSYINAVKAPTLSERDKAIRLKVVSVLLGVMGVLFGGGAAARAYLYFVGIGATPYDATVYSIIVWIIVIAIFWLAAFKLKTIEQYITKAAA